MLVDQESLRLLKGGKNNQVYEGRSGDTKVLVKKYFQHPADPRNRCATEFGFISFVWNQGIRCVPEPLSIDDQNGVAIYEFIEGTQITEVDNAALVDQAVTFFNDLNECRTSPEAAHLQAASEACFSIDAHLERADARVQSLLEIEDCQGRSFVQTKLVPAWRQVREDAFKQCHAFGLSLSEPVPDHERVLSPSDFGFHNALLRSNGEICFLDFEYAGWDDIAKAVCDFFLHPAVAVPLKYFETFVAALPASGSNIRMQRQRMDVLMPLHRVKWCCILLNDFLPVGDLRRRFSQGGEEEAERKIRQLNLADRMLSALQEGTMTCT